MDDSPEVPQAQSGTTARRILTGLAGIGLLALGIAVGIGVSAQFLGSAPAPIPVPTRQPVPGTAAWQAFAPPGGAFAMDFPANPTAGRQTLATGVGSAAATSYSAFHGLSLFALSYADVVGLGGVDQLDTLALTNGFLNGETATVTSTTPVNGEGYAGERVTATASGLVLTEQFLVASGRLFAAVVSAPTDTPAAAGDIDHFFTSFHVDVTAIPSPEGSGLAVAPGSSADSSAAPSAGQEPLNPNATPTPAATPQPTPPIAVPNLPTGWQSWYSPTWHVVLGYPSDWTATARERFDSFAAPGGNPVILLDTGSNDPPRSLDQIAADDAEAIRSQNGWRYESTTRDLLGSLPAVWISYHLVSSTGAQFEGIDIFALTGNVVIQSTWVGTSAPTAAQLGVLRQLLATVTLTP